MIHLNGNPINSLACRYCGLKFKHQIFGWIRNLPGPVGAKWQLK